jgi:large subunit ribosomal protein L28
MKGHKVSHSNVKTKRRFLPNLQKKRFFVPETNEWIQINVSTHALRNIDKLGIFDYLKQLKADGFDTGVTLNKK